VGQVGFAVIGMRDVLEGLGNEFRRRIAGELAQAAIDPNNQPFRRDMGNPNRRMFERGPEKGLAFNEFGGTSCITAANIGSIRQQRRGTHYNASCQLARFAPN
jgi:hypothetical protein